MVNIRNPRMSGEDGLVRNYSNRLDAVFNLRIFVYENVTIEDEFNFLFGVVGVSLMN